MNDRITQHHQIDNHFVQVGKMVWNNTDFNPVKFDGIKIQAGPNSFPLTIKKICESSEQLTCDHFVGMHKMVDIHSTPLTSRKQFGQSTDDHFHQVVKMVWTGSKIQSRRVGTFSVPMRALLISARVKNHAHPTLTCWKRGMGYGA